MSIDGKDVIGQVMKTIRNWNLSTEILLATQRQFFGFWSPLEPLPEEPAIYCANHQIGGDLSFLLWPQAFSTAVPASVVIAASAADSQHGKLISFLMSHPLHAAEDRKVQCRLISFDPDDPKTLKLSVEEMRDRLTTESIIVAVEGKVQSCDEQPVVRASSLLPSLSIRSGRPIVPLRVSGGLPSTPSHFRAFPCDYGQINAVSGAPIPAAELKALHPRQRVSRIIGAVNGLIRQGPTKRPESLQDPSAKSLAEAIAERQVRSGSSAIKCAVAELLIRGPLQSDEGRAFLKLFEPDVRSVPASLDSAWGRRFVLWLTDGLNLPEGPEKYEWLCETNQNSHQRHAS
ncbi:MAG: hypothetical protein ACOH2N_07350 [Devosia sp.]